MRSFEKFSAEGASEIDDGSADAARTRTAFWYVDGAVRAAVRPWVEVAKVLASDEYEPWLLDKLHEYCAPLLSAVRKPPGLNKLISASLLISAHAAGGITK